MPPRPRELWERHADPILLVPAALMLPIAIWRLLLAIDTQDTLCGDAGREHVDALLVQGVSALVIAGSLFMLRPSVVQGDERHRFGYVTLLVLAVVVFLGIFTTSDLLAFERCT